MTTAATTLSLGDILRNRLQAEKDDKLVKLEREARDAGEKAQRELRTIVEFFEDAKKVFTQNILDGVATTQIQVGKCSISRPGLNLAVESSLQTFQTIQVNDPHHKYFPVWDDFAIWASSNGLKPLWKFAHDGGGMASWRLLSVEPN